MRLLQAEPPDSQTSNLVVAALLAARFHTAWDGATQIRSVGEIPDEKGART